jgi:trans-AT polyketide synthase, acyltransferase and oxidoreductase domains
MVSPTFSPTFSQTVASTSNPTAAMKASSAAHGLLSSDSPLNAMTDAELKLACWDLRKSFRFMRGLDEYSLPRAPLDSLGDPSFCRDHGLRFPYVAGAMANGIASEELVIAMAKAGMLGIFGAAGLDVSRVEAAIIRLTKALPGLTFGSNLIHSPNEPHTEEAIVDLYLKHGVRLVEASAFMGLTSSVVRYRVTGIYRTESGEIIAPNKIIAKISRMEVASKFMAPPPEALLRDLVARGVISAQQAEWASQIPMAQDITAEADSGGHTDNRPAITLLPLMLALKDRLSEQFGYAVPLRVGAAGGIATPLAAAGAFAMGAAFIVTGTINQACLEAGTSDTVRAMLADAGQADIAMAPAADMFEMGVKVQVLKRGTMFAMRAQKLYDLYVKHSSWEDIPVAEREAVEKNFLKQSFAEAWASTQSFFASRDPKQNTRAETDAKHKMALVFRSYLGQSSRWANAGDPTRKVDYQVWCGPAMGAFNEWAKGSFLEAAKERRAVPIALNLLYGAAVCLRVQTLRHQGLKIPASWQNWRPISESELRSMIERTPS